MTGLVCGLMGVLFSLNGPQPPAIAQAQPTGADQGSSCQYQINFRIGGANNNAYTISALACQ